jgi:hypothetical protein
MPPFLASILAAISAAVAPEVNYIEQKLESVGASLASGLVSLLLGYTSDQRVIFTNMLAFYQAKVKSLEASGASVIDALEGAFTATLNEFCAEEAAEFNQEKTAFITLVNGALKQASTIV